MANCEVCDEKIKWLDIIIPINDKYYHKDCVKVYATSYTICLDDWEFIGESDDNGSEAYEYIEFNDEECI